MPVLIVSEKTWLQDGLLEEALDPPLLVGDDDPELERVLDRLEADRDGGALLLVDVDQLGQVDVAERVAGDDEEGLVEPVARQAHRAGGARAATPRPSTRCSGPSSRRRRSSRGSPAA
jgi:hypothetical protein